MTEALIALEEITKRFPGVLALDHISLEVQEGTIHAVVGENGAGKSTLMLTLAGIHAPDSGRIIVGGDPVHFADPLEANRRGIGIVFQELSVWPNLDVKENIFMGIEPRRGPLVDFAKMRRESEELLSRLGADFSPDMLVSELSLAQQQLAEIAKALARSPGILILDEPTSSLSPREIEDLFRVLRDLKAHGVTILYISHHLEEVFALCDAITVMRDGRHVLTRPTSELSQEAVIRAMVGRDLEEFIRHGQHRKGEVVLEVRNLGSGRRFGTVSFSLRVGEVVGMAGLVGAGRSELALSLVGFPPPDSGEILVEGRAIKIRSPQDALRHGIVLLPEDRNLSGLVLNMSVRENMTLAVLRNLVRGGMTEPSRERGVAEDLVRRLNIKTPGLETPVVNLSGGNQQKVLLGRSLTTEPKVLIMDEPTRGIDVGAKAEVQHLIDELAEDGLGVVMISSELEEMVEGSDRVVVLRNGAVVGVLSGDDISEENLMEELAEGGSSEDGEAAVE
jgi:ABC-type sugar transport system ATPase subunit